MDQIRRLNGFAPFMVMAFLNAFTDLGHKIIIQNTLFKVYDGPEQILLTAFVNALILIPFVALLSPAGFLSDRFSKPWVMRLSALAAVILTLAITLFYYLGWFKSAFAMTLLLAVQSAIYSPAKFGYLRQWAGEKLLSRANAAAQAVSIVAILSGILVFSLLFELRLSGAQYEDEGELLRQIAPLGWGLVACALLEFLLAFRLTAQPAADPGSVFQWPTYLRGNYLRHNLNTLRRPPLIGYAVIVLTLFWGISQVLLASYPAFAKEHLGIHNALVVQGLLASSGIGIISGSLLAGRLSKHHIESGLIPLAMVGVAACLLILPQLENLLLIGGCFAGLGLFGGLYIVPLNALIQFHAPVSQLGRVLAANNWTQNLVMLSFLLLTLLFTWQGLDALGLLYILLGVALFGCLLVPMRLPLTLARWFAGWRSLGEPIAGLAEINLEHPTLLLVTGKLERWSALQAALATPIHWLAPPHQQLSAGEKYLLRRLNGANAASSYRSPCPEKLQSLMAETALVAIPATIATIDRLKDDWQAAGGQVIPIQL